MDTPCVIEDYERSTVAVLFSAFDDGRLRFSICQGCFRSNGEFCTSVFRYGFNCEICTFSTILRSNSMFCDSTSPAWLGHVSGESGEC